jgi:hypothetical protein
LSEEPQPVHFRTDCGIFITSDKFEEKSGKTVFSVICVIINIYMISLLAGFRQAQGDRSFAACFGGAGLFYFSVQY